MFLLVNVYVFFDRFFIKVFEHFAPKIKFFRPPLLLLFGLFDFKRAYIWLIYFYERLPNWICDDFDFDERSNCKLFSYSNRFSNCLYFNGSTGCVLICLTDVLFCLTDVQPDFLEAGFFEQAVDFLNYIDFGIPFKSIVFIVGMNSYYVWLIGKTNVFFIGCTFYLFRILFL